MAASEEHGKLTEQTGKKIRMFVAKSAPLTICLQYMEQPNMETFLPKAMSRKYLLPKVKTT